MKPMSGALSSNLANQAADSRGGGSSLFTVSSVQSRRPSNNDYEDDNFWVEDFTECDENEKQGAFGMSPVALGLRRPEQEDDSAILRLHSDVL